VAAMSTVLTEFNKSLNNAQWYTSTHTALKPRLVMEKRKVPSGNQTVLEDTITVLHATADAAGVNLPQRVSLSVTVRRPVDGAAADMTAALAIFRDIIAGDEFALTTTSQKFLK